MGWEAFSWLRLSREQVERRRRAAGRDLQAGLRQAHVARKDGVREASVSRWAKALRHGGPEALRARKATGVSPKLDRKDLRRLPELLARGPMAYGGSTGLWTTKRVATVIEREFGVGYHYNPVGRLLRALGFPWRKPRRQAREKDEDVQGTWLRTTWRRIRKNS